MGNPAAGPLVTYLLPIVLMSGAAFPVRQDHHVRRHDEAVLAHPFPGYPPLPLRRGDRPRAGLVPASAATTLAIHLTAAKGASTPMSSR